MKIGRKTHLIKPDPPHAGTDLPAFRERLVVSRTRLIERIILEYDPERAYPDTAWTRMVADLHVVIMAVDAMMEEARP